MEKQINIQNLKNEANNFLNKALKLIDNDQLGSACLQLKQAVLRAEEIFHATKDELDKEFLLDCYMHMAKYYSKVYYLTLERNDIVPACTYYEKIIYFHDENKKITDENIVSFRKMMEAYVQLLWIALEIKDFHMYNKFSYKAYIEAKKLLRVSKTYDDEQYLILIMIFQADYYKMNGKFRRAYIVYYFAMRKMKRIFDELPKDDIKNDLLLIYNNLSELAKILKLKKQKDKWNSLIKLIEGEKYNE